MRLFSRALVTSLTVLSSFSAFAADQDCAFGTFNPERERQRTIHRLSVSAEAVAGSGRQRAVGKTPGGPAPRLQIANFIDTYVGAKQYADGVVPTTIASDEEFFRRVSLDLAGIIPDAAEVEAFVADTSMRFVSGTLNSPSSEEPIRPCVCIGISDCSRVIDSTPPI